MKKHLLLFSLVISFVLSGFVLLYAQKVETAEVVRVVHNGKRGKWGKNPDVSLQFVRKIGKLDAENENEAFYIPVDIAFDSRGNIYILDSGNHRIQKFDSKGRFLESFGNKGQGPGEFYFPVSIDVDARDYLYISDPQNKRIQILKPGGKEQKTISLHKAPIGIVRTHSSGNLLMGKGGFLDFSFGGINPDEKPTNLLWIIDSEGKVQKNFVQPVDYKDFLLNKQMNNINFSVDSNSNIYIAFEHQNRIEKYSPDGKLLWKADRKLGYSTSPPKTKGALKGSRGNMRISMPKLNRCSSGIAVDSKERVWVISLKRQLKEEEEVKPRIMATMSGGQRNISLNFDGNTEFLETDIYELEVYSPEGILLGKLPLKHFVDGISIENDRLYLLDRTRGMLYYEYKTVEKEGSPPV